MEYGILFVEDEKEITEMLRETLTDACNEGRFQRPMIFYEAATVPEAKKRIAEALASRQTIDAAVVDLILPGGSGTDVIDALLRQSPQTKVMVLSATAANYGDSLLKRYGGQLQIVEKPMKLSFFEQKVREMLETNSVKE